MEKKELEENQQKILMRLAESFEQADVFSVVVPKEDAGVADTLVVQHTQLGEKAEEALGEYYFLPLTEENMLYQYFVCSITLSEDIEPEKQAAFEKVISYINFALPLGAFRLNLQGNLLCFRYTLMMEADKDLDHMELMVRSSMINSIQLVTQWADLLDGLEYGRITLEDFEEEFLKRSL